MNTKLERWKEQKFLRYFLKKEKDFLMNFNIEAYKSDDFKFYMSWFIYAINDYIDKNYNIDEYFSYIFCNNGNLNIIYLPYILSADFRKRVIGAITESKQKYKTEQIFEF